MCTEEKHLLRRGAWSRTENKHLLNCVANTKNNKQAAKLAATMLARTEKACYLHITYLSNKKKRVKKLVDNPVVKQQEPVVQQIVTQTVHLGPNQSSFTFNFNKKTHPGNIIIRYQVIQLK